MGAKPYINLVDASVDFPIYDARSRSFRDGLLSRIGGNITSNGKVPMIRALTAINLSLLPGDRLAILGSNGAGKSTLLRVFAGAYEPRRGTADICGTVSSLLDLTLGMDFELTGQENILLRGSFVGISRANAMKRVPEIADFSGLVDYLHLPVRTYSSGMLLRLAFSISTAAFPDIMLLDEMIGAGDQEFAAKASKRIENMMDNASILALASHDPATLKRYCNRAVLLANGRITAEGTVADVFAAYEAQLNEHVHRESQPAHGLA